MRRYCLLLILFWLGLPNAHSLPLAAYPMFQFGQTQAPANQIDFFWTPSESESALLYAEVIAPLLARHDPGLLVNFYFLANEYSDDPYGDAEAGAILRCVPAHNMPLFAIDILQHDSSDADVRNLAELFEASRTYGNTAKRLEDCLVPSTIAQLIVTSRALKTTLGLSEAPALWVIGGVLEGSPTLEDVTEFLVKDPASGKT